MSRIKMKRPVLCLSIALALGALAPVAQAQVLDEVVVARQQGEKVDITIQFNAKVRFKRFVVAPSNDVAAIFFDITGLDDQTKLIAEESRKWERTGLVPAFTTRYSKQSGQPTERRIDISFDAPVQVLQIGPGEDDQSLVMTLLVPETSEAPDAGTAPQPAVPVPMPPAGTTPGQAASTKAQEQAALLAAAREAIQREELEKAIAILNRLLNMPIGPGSQEAQELVGAVREKLGETNRARLEYELYLKLYPQGEGANRVRERLATLAAAPAPGSSAGSRERKPVTSSWGGISQYYYGGNSKIRDEFTITTPATGATEIDIQNISTTDQSSIVTDVNYNIRHRSENWDTRFTFRDTFRNSFLDAQPSRNRLSSAYVDLKNEKHRFGTRLGRQVAASGGVLGRFDGAVANYGFGSGKVRVGFEGGRLVEPGLGGTKDFWGLTLDADNIVPNLGLELFAIQQDAGGVTDRRAIGGELRYFDSTRSVFSLFDYDVMFKELNIASVQGNWSFNDNAMTINFLYDYRRSPSLQMSNALLGQSETSLSQLGLSLSQAQIEAQALGLTPISKVASLGATFAVSSRWQLGADYRVSSVSGTIATPMLPASPSTGQVKTISAQAIGTGIFIPSGVLVLNTSFLTSASYDAWLVGVSTRFKAGPKWLLEPGVKYYVQDNASGTTSKRLAPVGRISYQWREHVSLEAEFNIEKTRSVAVASNENVTSMFYYIGYRYDF